MTDDLIDRTLSHIDALDAELTAAQAEIEVLRVDRDTARQQIAALTAERDALRTQVIDHLQREEATKRLGEMLENLSFWPSVDEGKNLARDAGRLLLGKSAERSNLGDLFRIWHGPVLPSLKRAEALEADRDTARQQLAALRAAILRLAPKCDCFHELRALLAKEE